MHALWCARALSHPLPRSHSLPRSLAPSLARSLLLSFPFSRARSLSVCLSLSLCLSLSVSLSLSLSVCLSLCLSLCLSICLSRARARVLSLARRLLALLLSPSISRSLFVSLSLSCEGVLPSVFSVVRVQLLASSRPRKYLHDGVLCRQIVSYPAEVMLEGAMRPARVYRKHAGPVHCLAVGDCQLLCRANALAARLPTALAIVGTAPCC